jgi:hypothetical protein
MKLAEALTERKALQEKLARLRARLTANARVQEGDEPAERPTTLLAEVAEAATALENLTVRINRTNVEATLADEPRLTLMEAVARRDMLKLRFTALSELIGAAAPAPGRFIVTRPVKFRRWRSRTPEATRRAGSRDRDLDARLQAANWSVEPPMTSPVAGGSRGWRQSGNLAGDSGA